MSPDDAAAAAMLLEDAGYSGDLDGLCELLTDLGAAHALLAELLADGDDRVALLHAADHLDRARARRERPRTPPHAGDA